MTISIIQVRVQDNSEFNLPNTRTADFIITQNAVSWFFSKGGFALTGAMQGILDATEADLWIEANAAQIPVTAFHTELANWRAWFVANPSAKAAIFDGTPDDLNTGLTTLLLAVLPLATAGQRTQMRYALMAGLAGVRLYAVEMGLI